MTQTGETLASFFKFRSAYERQVFWTIAAATVILAGVAVFTSPLKVLAVIITLIAIGLSITRPYLVVVALAIWTPFEPFLLKFVPDELYVYARYFPESLIYLMAGLVTLHVLLERRKLPTTPIDLPFVLFMVTVLASALLNLVPPSIALLGIRQIIRYNLPAAPCGIEGFWDYNCALRSVQNRHRARPNGCKNDDEKNRFIFDISFMDQPQAGFQYRSMIPEKVSFFIGSRIL